MTTVIVMLRIGGVAPRGDKNIQVIILLNLDALSYGISKEPTADTAVEELPRYTLYVPGGATHACELLSQ